MQFTYTKASAGTLSVLVFGKQKPLEQVTSPSTPVPLPFALA